jgi:DNA repair protein RecN (Recombination protein N)
MLKLLRSHHLALVEQADIEFHTGFNVITGETGAGKSAVLQALKLLTGEKADSSLIRSGATQGSVEALFDCSAAPHILQELVVAGIDSEEEGTLLIKRTLTTQGRGKIYINHQLAHRSLLQKVVSSLLQIVGQHASRALLSADTHRQLVDRYGSITAHTEHFSKLWQQMRLLERKYDTLLQAEHERQRTMETLRREVAELVEAQPKAGEEEELFAEYTRLMHAETLQALTHEITAVLEADNKGIIPLLARCKRSFDKLIALDPTLEETGQLAHNAYIELQEVCHTLHNYTGRIVADPMRATVLDNRLSLLNQLKRKYGPDITAVCSYREQAESRLSALENYETTLSEMQAEIDILQKQLDNASVILTQKRTETARLLEQSLTAELRELNMPQVTVDIAITSCQRCASGDDVVEIFLTPNKGEKRIPLRQSVSGGEMARTLLALQYLLAGKGEVATLVFDEIDANIGGQTATLVGAKLKSIGEKQQVVCVTHFAQVAKQAHQHLLISKAEQGERTLTTVTSLRSKETIAELKRMAGTLTS